MYPVIVAFVMLLPIVVIAEPATTRPVTTQPGSDFDRLLEKLPTALSDDPSIRSFAVVAEIKEAAFPILIYVAQRSPDDRMMYLAYATDHVPFLYWANGDAILFDSVNGVVRRMTKVSSELKLSLLSNATTGKTDFSFAFSVNPNKKDQPSTMKAPVDLRSFLRTCDQRTHMGREGDLDVLTGRSPRNIVVTSWLDNAKPMPLLRMTMQIEAEPPMIVFHRISVNEPVEGEPFTIPSEEELRKILPVGAVDGGFFDKAKLMLALGRSVVCRMALTSPEMRPQVEKFLGKVDWQERAKKDAELAAPLIKLLGERIPTTQPATRPAN